MKILFVASELTPIAKVGGLGDVVGALSKSLHKLGTDVQIVVPRYHFIPKKGLKLIEKNISISLGSGFEKVSLYKTRLPSSGAPVFLIENNKYLSSPPGPYFESTAFAGAKKEIQRFAFFSKAVFEILSRNYAEDNAEKRGKLLSFRPDVVHCNDWHTGALVSLLTRKTAEFYAEKRGKNISVNQRIHQRKSALPKAIFTIHNLSNQGKWNSRESDKWFFGKKEQPIFKKFGKDYNFIAEGILNTDFVTTVSPTYAREILTPKYGAGLDSALRSRKKNLTGILNGLDYDFWSPGKDKFIFQNYSAKNISLKTINKTALQKSLKLNHDAAIPLFGLVARLTSQKGIDFIIKSLPGFLKKFNAQFIFLGRGAPEYEQALTKLAQKFPEQIYAKIGFDEALAHKIYAASDFFLMPSRFEPSGLGQMIAMRYGAIPIVRDTGGLHDTVKHLKTGFVFKIATTSDFEKAVKTARKYYLKYSKKLAVIQKNCLNENFDFSRSAQEYLKLYKTALSL